MEHVFFLQLRSCIHLSINVMRYIFNIKKFDCTNFIRARGKITNISVRRKWWKNLCKKKKKKITSEQEAYYQVHFMLDFLYSGNFTRRSWGREYILAMSLVVLHSRTKARVDSLVTLVKPLNLHKNVPPWDPAIRCGREVEERRSLSQNTALCCQIKESELNF